MIENGPIAKMLINVKIGLSIEMQFQGVPVALVQEFCILSSKLRHNTLIFKIHMPTPSVSP